MHQRAVEEKSDQAHRYPKVILRDLERLSGVPVTIVLIFSIRGAIRLRGMELTKSSA